MIDAEYLKNEYEELFTSDGYIKTDDEQRIVKFCKILSMLTGIQTCDKYGQTYEYIHDVYLSALHILENGEGVAFDA